MTTTTHVERRSAALLAVAGVVVFVAGVFSGSQLDGVEVVEKRVQALSGDGAICLVDELADAADPRIGDQEGVLEEGPGQLCARLADELGRAPLRLGDAVRASVVTVDAVDGLAGAVVIVDYEVLAP